MTDSFGTQLKQWRGRRRMSQLQLALVAEVSARHLAFLETGRARPSRAMVMRLGEALEMPLGVRNHLLDAAGFRAAYGQRTLHSSAMAPFRRAIDHMIQAHAPYPAFVFDRHWLLLDANATGKALLAGLGTRIGESFIDLLLQPGRGPELVENWVEVATHLAARFRLESTHLGGDPVLDRAATELALHLDPARTRDGDLPPVVPVRFRIGDGVYPVFSTVAQFGTAEDIALADIKIELFFPEDDATDQLFRSMAG
ncbi:helix-turn-helix domain-containing protein [Devosia sp.]|jgi:transcriptional regulator with XRE-family HTH domain|uniref:MmyB family transcriptional regulator n=1 Tax=Devosia sp. TaxID=1871048 RepID=UPI0037C18934